MFGKVYRTDVKIMILSNFSQESQQQLGFIPGLMYPLHKCLYPFLARAVGYSSGQLQVQCRQTGICRAQSRYFMRFSQDSPISRISFQHTLRIPTPTLYYHSFLVHSIYMVRENRLVYNHICLNHLRV